jgi:hypothetical protein
MLREPALGRQAGGGGQAEGRPPLPEGKLRLGVSFGVYFGDGKNKTNL